jgi:hypothetical protein
LRGLKETEKEIVLVGIIVVVMVVAAVFVGTMYSKPSSGEQFTVVGKEWHLPSANGDTVTTWNFTFAYNGDKTLLDVELYLNNNTKPFLVVPEMTEGWTDYYTWTPSNVAAPTEITIEWQNGIEQYEFQP